MVNRKWQPIAEWFSKKIVSHSILWGVFFLFLLVSESGNHGFLFLFSNELLNVLFFIALVYFNLYYLIPLYLNKKKFLPYFGLLALSVLIVTPIRNIIFYFKFSDYPALQNLLLQNQNWYFLVNFVVVGCSTVVNIISEWLRDQREKQELQTQTMQSELRFLKSQINPHFLFNTLNNLYALTLKKSDDAPKIVVKLSEMMRYMLYECNEKRVPLSKEVNYLKNYLDLELLRQGKNIALDFQVKGEIGQQKIAPLLFIPFLENSFKHGLNHHIEKGFVKIQLQIKADKIEFFIENSKPETLPLSLHRRSGGIGLVNVKRRLELLYPERYELQVKDNPKSFLVHLHLNTL